MTALDRFDALLALRRYELAEEEINRVIRQNPNDVGALYALVNLQARMGHHGSARTNLDRCLSLAPEMPELHAHKALFDLEANRRRAARRSAARALELDPSNPFGHQAQLRVHLAFDRVGRALAEAHLLVEQRPDDPGRLALLAEVQIRAGRRREAEETLRRRLSLAPDDASAIADLADLLARRPLRGHGQAAKLYLTAAKTDPSDEQTLKRLGDHSYRRSPWRWLVMPVVVLGAIIGGAVVPGVGIVVGGVVGGIIGASPVAWLATRRLEQLILVGKLSAEEEGIRHETIKAIRRNPLGQSTGPSSETSPIVLAVLAVVVVGLMAAVSVAAAASGDSDVGIFFGLVALLVAVPCGVGIWRLWH